MTWSPKKADLERIAEYELAGMALEQCARFIECTPAELAAWRLKCAEAARDEYIRMMEGPPPAPVAKPAFK